MTTPSPLSLRLKALRERAGLRPVELGELVGLKSPANVSMIERGDRGPRLSATLAVHIARTLGCTVEWLVEGIGSEPDEFAVRAAVARAEAIRDARKADPNEIADHAPTVAA